MFLMLRDGTNFVVYDHRDDYPRMHQWSQSAIYTYSLLLHINQVFNRDSLPHSPGSHQLSPTETLLELSAMETYLFDPHSTQLMQIATFYAA